MATSELLLQLVYFMKVTVHYELNSMSIVTLIACHLTYFYSREILDYTFITSKPSQRNKDTLHFLTLNTVVWFGWLLQLHLQPLRKLIVSDKRVPLKHTALVIMPEEDSGPHQTVTMKLFAKCITVSEPLTFIEKDWKLRCLKGSWILFVYIRFEKN